MGWFMFIFGWSLAATVLALLYGCYHILYLYECMRKSCMCHFAEDHSTLALATVRPLKFDKESVTVTALQKCGSTVLCYICALLNTANGIHNFRNDFDIMPMLSFPQWMFKQNFNARQDGKYQMFKINGRMEVMEKHMQGYKKIWMIRGINGYFVSNYWWTQTFYPMIKKTFEPFKWIKFHDFKKMYFELVSNEHIQDCFYMYTRLQAGEKYLYVTTYEVLVKNKKHEVQKLAKALQVNLSELDIDSICEKTSKKSMAEVDRFDPVHFGDGDGLSKINLEPHPHKLSDIDMEWYDQKFKEKFAGTGIECYDDFSKWISEFQL